ncbi:hypothetical protein V1525DRAFT_422081 [Lipomyces kononenkoae]|uniref:Uncharacterized protein n=1 Tax=Lipomyces kononenkoae TaxID=34357 RepID=A0ACC3SSK9_LIPKO
MESDLKNEWSTKNMDARSERMKQGNLTSRHTGKRKMAVAEDVYSPVKKPRTKQTARCSSRGRASNVSFRKVEDKADTTENPPRKKQTARRGGMGVSGRGGASNVSLSEVEDKADTTGNPPRKKQTARRGGMGVSGRGGASNVSLSKVEDKADTTENPPRKKQTARRGGMEVTPRYHAFNGHKLDGDIERENTYDLDECEPGGYSNPVSASSQGLGQINGVYEIRSDDLDQWSGYPQEEFTVILGLSGNAVWGAYDFGMYHGILYIPNRPCSASQARVPFTWRGRERGEGEMSFDEDNEGYICFLGNGKIEGEINCYGQAKFIGWRTTGNHTGLSRSVASMQSEWNGYNSREYERERVARWH